MVVVALIEVAFIVTMVGVVVTQIALPLLAGSKMFPWIRRRGVRAEMRDTTEGIQKERERSRAIRLRQRLDRLRVRVDRREGEHHDNESV